MKKKGLLIALGVLACLLMIGAYVFFIALPVVPKFDKSLIKTNPEYNVFVEERNGYKTLVKKDKNGNILDDDFKIIAFTDTHLDQRQKNSNYTMEYIVRNIVNEKPDFVIFVGDNITGGMNKRRTKAFGKTLEKLGVYWDCVLGNHEGDNNYCISREKMVSYFDSLDYCLIESDVKYTSDGEKVWGNGNHAINLADSSGVIRTLYFIDGGLDMSGEDMEKYKDEYTANGYATYDYVKTSQIKWYEETVEDIWIKNGAEKPIVSVLFDHIPVPEYKIAYEELTGETEVTQNVPEYNVKNENGNYMIMGQRREAICCPGHNSGLFDAVLKAGSTDLMVCGHDHVNDFVLSYKGIVLSYNVPSGYSSYNVYSKGLSDTLIKGFTRYTFKTDGTYRLEQIHNADLYPEAQDEIKKLYKK